MSHNPPTNTKSLRMRANLCLLQDTYKWLVWQRSKHWKRNVILYTYATRSNLLSISLGVDLNFFLLIDLPMCFVFYTAQHFRFCSYCTHVVGWTDECSGSITDVWIRIKQAGYSNLSAHSSATCLSCCWLMPCWVEAYWALMAMPLQWGLIGPGSGEGEGSNRSCHDKQALSRQITQEWWCKII